MTPGPQMFSATGAGMSKFKNWQNGGRRQRRSLDKWDRVSKKNIRHPGSHPPTLTFSLSMCVFAERANMIDIAKYVRWALT